MLKQSPTHQHQHQHQHQQGQDSLSDTPLPMKFGAERVTFRSRHLNPDQATRVVETPIVPVLTDAHSPPCFPQVGECFYGFHLRSELGRGSFGRVFLAEQNELGGRTVALKITTRPSLEAQKLARLQHTNIMPVYSVHDQPPLQAICMPYLGERTLADLIECGQTTSSFPWRDGHRRSTAPVCTGPTEEITSEPAPRPTPPPTRRRVSRQPLLNERTHEERVIDVIRRIAEGLEHAHTRGILHLDLKPANILITDEDEPLILDFNLAYDVQQGERGRTGGTVRYMSPEQLEEFQSGTMTPLDQRADLYSLGMIFFEMLTGRYPFMEVNRFTEITEVLRERRTVSPTVRSLSPSLSVAVESVVLKLLAPKLDDRYESAFDLITDLKCIQQHQPLRFAANRSQRERAANWRKRHPHAHHYLLLSLAMVAFCGMGYGAIRHYAAQEVSTARHHSESLREAIGTLRLDLTMRDDIERRQEALSRGEQLLAKYHLPQDADWQRRPMVASLPPDERATLTDSLGELALLMAHAEWLNTRLHGEASFQRARQWNHAAELCFADRPAPLVMLEQANRLGRPITRSAEAVAPISRIDLYLRGAERLARNDILGAMPQFQRLASQEPTHFAGQFSLALCKQEIGEPVRALERFEIAQVLAPSDPRAFFHRGLLQLLVKNYPEAEREFDSVLKLDSHHAKSYQYRAMARLYRVPSDPHAALADSARALELGYSSIPVHLLQAEAHAKLGDVEAERQKRELAQTAIATTAVDFLARGNAVSDDNPKAALLDYTQAAEQNPNFYYAWLNLAIMQSDRLHQHEEALVSLDRALTVAPSYAPTIMAQAIVLARLGRIADSQDAAQRALLLSADPRVLYRAACVYSLNSRNAETTDERAYQYLRRAFRAGFQDFELIERDSDLDPIRHTREFQEILRAANSVKL